MASLGDIKLTPTSVLAGVGIALAVPVALPVVAAMARPLAKNLIKGYLSLAHYSRELAAEGAEKWGDLVAEARSEHVGAAPVSTEQPHEEAHASPG